MHAILFTIVVVVISTCGYFERGISRWRDCSNVIEQEVFEYFYNFKKLNDSNNTHLFRLKIIIFAAICFVIRERVNELEN